MWDLNTLIIFLLLALVAEILGTVGAFGSSVFFIPVASLFLEFHLVLGLTGVFHVISNISKIAMFKKGIDKRLLIYLGIPAVIMVIIGAFLTSYIDAEKLELGLGIMLLLLSAFFLLFPQIRVKSSNRNAVVGGVLSGGLAGVLGSGGPIRGLTLASFGLSKDVFIATSAVIDLGVDFSRTVVYSSQGYVTKEILLLIPFLIFVSVLGTYIGKRILKFIPQAQFNKMVLYLIMGIGITIVIGQIYKL